MILRCAAMGQLTATFLAALAIPAAGQTGANCAVSDLDEYDFMHSPVHGFLIYWTQPTTEISFMVEAEAEEWTAVGFSTDGSMVGSDAVIYLPEEDDVSEYILASQSVTNILAISGDEDELTTVEFSQSGGDTIFSFTRYTTPGDQSKMTIPNTPGSPIYIIWAEGLDNGFGYHGQDNRGAFLVDLFCGTDVDTDTSSALETPTPTATGTMEGTVGSTSAATRASGTNPPAPVLTTAPSSAAPAALAPGTTAPAPSLSPAPVTSASLMPAVASTAPIAPSVTMPPGGFVPAPMVSLPSPSPTDGPLPASLGIVFGSDAPAASAASPAPAAAGLTTPLPMGETVAPVSEARAIGDAGGTPPPSSNSTGFVGGAARASGGVTGAALASAVAAVCFGVVWATNV